MILLPPNLLQRGDVVYCMYQIPYYQTDDAAGQDRQRLGRGNDAEPVLVGAWLTVVSDPEDYCGVSTRFFGVPEEAEPDGPRRFIEYNRSAMLAVKRDATGRPDRASIAGQSTSMALGVTEAYVADLEAYADRLEGEAALRTLELMDARITARKAEHIIDLARQMARALEDL